jgi:hypothetical protein
VLRGAILCSHSELAEFKTWDYPARIIIVAILASLALLEPRKAVQVFRRRRESRNAVLEWGVIAKAGRPATFASISEVASK